MKIAWAMLYFGLCLTVSTMIVSDVLGVNPILIQDTIDMKDPDEIVETWNWGGTGSLVGDVSSGLRFFWDINVPFIESFIIFAKNAGCPLPILDAMKILWRFIWNTFVIEFLSGRHIMYD